MTEESLDSTLSFSKQWSAWNLQLEINEKIYKAIADLDFHSNTVINGQKKPQTVKFIDFDNMKTMIS